MDYILSFNPVFLFFFSTPNRWRHWKWTDLNQTWTRIHLWLLSPGR